MDGPVRHERRNTDGQATVAPSRMGRADLSVSFKGFEKDSPWIAISGRLLRDVTDIMTE